MSVEAFTVSVQAGSRSGFREKQSIMASNRPRSGSVNSESVSVLTEASSPVSMIDREGEPLLSKRIADKNQATERKLGMIFGVTIPCCLSIFSVIIFLRLGFVLGQAGFWETMAMLILGYLVVMLTVLSISAIATSATVEGGGVYFMISRALGPEFGGSVGIIFFVANIFASAAYIIGFVEALVSNLGEGGSLLVEYAGCDDCGLPGNYWFNFLYGTAVLFFCLIVCLIGAGMFAKATFIIFCAVMLSLASAMFSFGFLGPMGNITVPVDNHLFPVWYGNETLLNYTSWSWNTFLNNLGSNYTIDYTNQAFGVQNFSMVFAVMFNGCSGIMAGANISGDLKNPSYSIPQGTLLACGITMLIYAILFTFIAFTVPRELMLHNYNYLQYINVFAPLMTLGVFAATLSASLSNLIGASRVLQALAKDRLFSGILHPFTWTVGKSQNPIPAVLLSWFLVQITLFLGQFNTIAPLVTMFFLVSYGVVNLACFALKFASAVNFRPTFQVYARYTSVLGVLSCVILMFVISPEYAGVTIAVMVLLFIYLLIRGPATPWGDVSQALIYHQVRKYLLRLDKRKSHVKFWRPEVLLLVNNPRSSLGLIEFTNDMKKGGLFVLGHVVPRPFSRETANYYTGQLNAWLTFVEISKVKAFVELSIAPSIRMGTQNLLATAGLGGMKPNTIALGFYDDSIPRSQFINLKIKLSKRPQIFRSFIRDQSVEKFDRINQELPFIRTAVEDQVLSLDDYVGVIQDASIMGKNVCIMRHFETLDKKQLKARPYIDVWPHQVTFESGFDNTFMLVLQLACVLNMKGDWKSSTKIRIFVVVEKETGSERMILNELLTETRISAQVHMLSPPGQEEFGTFSESFRTNSALSLHSAHYHTQINRLMQEHSSNASVIFTSLPAIPDDLREAKDFYDAMDTLSCQLPPTVLVYGNAPVMSPNI
ncbi:solute carrier family 12 member 9-like [Halichondria panicea]|uniref:solute carrier family 12 member 9-like n=1 Tax=Halichondria panicea TaxID=6063 RepID=UPI00312BC13F